MKPKVICFGEILFDQFGEDKKAGGAPMNVALHLHKQNVCSELISAVGDDENGKELKRFIQNHGLDTSFVQTVPHLPTGIVNVKLDKKNQATYTIVKPVAWDSIEYAENLADLISGADALVFGSLVCREATSKSTLLKLIGSAKLRIFDMNLRPPHFTAETLEQLLKQTDILKINEHELEYLNQEHDLENLLIKEQLGQLAGKYNLTAICVTLGDKGAMVWDKGDLYNHPGFSVNVVDTVGAGDAFLAAYIAGYLCGKPIQETLTTACAAGALIASKPGANPDYDIKEISAIANR